jgi:hypothetical protein
VTVLIGIFVVGSLGLWIADHSFPPVEQTILLVGMFVLWLVGGSILAWGKKNDDGNPDSDCPKKLYLIVTLIPWLACAVVVANAALDSSTASVHTTMVASRSPGRYGSTVDVVSWSSRGITKRIPVNDACYNLLTPGTNVVVNEKRGALGIRWVASIAGCSH